MFAQGTIGWHRQRLGCITGSKVGLLMKSGRSKTEMFSEAAKTYIYQLAAERCMNEKIVNDDDLFTIYLEETSVSTKAMRWGTEQEANARNLYAKITKKDVIETGLMRHTEIKNFASSSDGFSYDDGEKISLEIKCFQQDKFMKMRHIVKDNATLLAQEPCIFYQCMAHIMCNKADAADFVLYNPFQKHPIHIVRITPDNDVFEAMAERIKVANEMIDEIVKNVQL